VEKTGACNLVKGWFVERQGERETDNREGWALLAAYGFHLATI